jgi:hypothetical protein
MFVCVFICWYIYVCFCIDSLSPSHLHGGQGNVTTGNKGCKIACGLGDVLRWAYMRFWLYKEMLYK